MHVYPKTTDPISKVLFSQYIKIYLYQDSMSVCGGVKSWHNLCKNWDGEAGRKNWERKEKREGEGGERGNNTFKSKVLAKINKCSDRSM